MIILLFTIIICSQAILGQNSTDVKSINNIYIDSLIETKMNETGIVGIGASIIINNEIKWIKGYGYSDKENQIPFTPSTIMNIGSISKTFTGACIMKDVEEGKVSLDEDINKYLPFKIINPNYPHAIITLRHLGTHTSGLADRYPFYSDSTYYYNGDKPEPLGEFLESYFSPGGKYYSIDNFLNFKPGEYRDYSNIGAGLAGYIVELRTGKKLNDYAKEFIFKPLKMDNTGWSLADIDLNNHSKLYQEQGESITQIPLYEVTTYPDGGVRTSVSELSRFFICLLNEGEFGGSRILKKESAAGMLRFQFTESSHPQNVNINDLNSGIFWGTKMDASRIGHNGSDPGVRTFMLADLNKEIGIIIFFNTSVNEEEERVFFDIYKELYKYAAALKK